MQAWTMAGLALALVVAAPATAPAQSEALQEIIRKGAELYSAGRYAEAEPLWREALERGEREFGPQEPRTANLLNNLAEVYRATGRYAAAEPLYQRAIAIDEKTLGPEHPSLAVNLWNLAAFYVAARRWSEAEPLYQRVLAIYEETLPADHPHIAQAREHYARLLDRLGRGDEATVLRAQAAPPGPREPGGTK
jgi:tetratricopeptide (TPR) repeat protein